jgi:preprotein translocase subunit YajC
VEGLAGFLPFILIALVFWFLIVRPQRRRQQELASTQSALAPGAEVMLGSGIYGIVTAVEDDTVRLDVAAGTTIKVARQAVIKVVDPMQHSEEHSEEHSGSDSPALQDRDRDAGADSDSTPADNADERHP